MTTPHDDRTADELMRAAYDALVEEYRALEREYRYRWEALQMRIACLERAIQMPPR